jgi:hypothetical protein
VARRGRPGAAGVDALKTSMTQDRHLGRRITDQQTAEVLEGFFGNPENEQES